ncbi:enoyl-CoA hydratase [Limobrevibacterium gyesilva]|uniref:Enoyl-CoA hydratase n=1 Tax=Limobrevibacterium gyesilva TaxID=2991712 RepID=A0AA42CHF9_9PROT|nr:enoyl-CoA hydratase [Limobrevibacterium gyesilva]MCW3477211.1 enoyl-CoA hydratase [Limobrevibacterium gyesilva]
MDAPNTIELPTTRMIARIDGPIGWMIFNNQERRNAVSLDMWEAMPLILDRFEQDPAVRVIVLRGAGEKAFVSGADISQFEQQRSSPETVAHYESVAEKASKRLSGTSKPTIAMIQGFCIGGGVGIAVGCDLRIAGQGAKFGVPASRLGLGYGPAGVKKLMDLVGPAHVKEIFYTSRHFNAAEALAMGLVNRVLPEAVLEAYVRAYGDMIAENAPLTMQALKRTVEELLRTSPDADLALCERLVQGCFDSEDYVEGRRAFMEKRRPVFKGR